MDKIENSIDIQYVRLNDAYSAKVVGLILPIQQDEFKVQVSLEDQPDLLQLENSYHQTGGGFWGALKGEEVVGTIGLIRFSPTGGAIRKMFVQAPYRGKEYGIAARLLQILLTHCREKGITDIYLGTVEKLQAALRFYEKNGFTRVDKADLPSSFPRMEVDTHFYHLRIH